MNERFFLLPLRKQQAIINAGYKVFSHNSYKKSPMSEIAEEAGISKSLLFHYFANKKELYIFLWEKSGEVTERYLSEYGSSAETDLFEIMLLGLKAKIQIMREYPDLSAFVMKAYYERDQVVCHDIQEIASTYSNIKTNAAMQNIDNSVFKEDIDIKLMYQEMYWASKGYMWEIEQNGCLDVDAIEKDFVKLIEFWKKNYLKRED